MTSPLSPLDAQKQRAAQHAVSLVQQHMKVGLGTGSTAAFAVHALAARIKNEGLRIKAVPTSIATQTLAEALQIPLLSFDHVERLDLCFDGADEVDAGLNLTKGGGGALLREKVVAHCADRFVCIVDAQKVKAHLGAFPLPVEVVPFAQKVVERELVHLGAVPTLRLKNGAPFVTDNGLYIVDAQFPPIANPPLLARALADIPGIAEHGLFCGMCSEVVVGHDDNVQVLRA